MSISGVSGGYSSIREAFQKMRSNGGITKDDLTTLQSQLKSKKLSAGISELAESFDSIDVDQNGKLDQSEMQTYSKSAGVKAPPSGGEPPAMTKEELSQMASETGDESLSAAVESFDEADTDKDGKVSRAEYETFAKLNGLTIAEPPSEGAGGEEMTKEQLSEMAEESDDEGLSKLVASFDEADTDGSGTISHDEFMKFAKANGIKPRGPHGRPPEEESESDAASTSETSSSSSTTEASSTEDDTTSLALQSVLKAYWSSAFYDDSVASLLDSIAA